MLIEFDTVSVTRSGRSVLNNVHISFQEQRIGIIGVNGAGKSTLARLINGLLEPTSGTVRLDGRNVQEHLKTVRQQVGFVFQNPDNQIVMPVVQEDLAFGLRYLPTVAMRLERVRQTLERLGIESLEQRAIERLSGGQKQLVSLAGALCRQPQLLVMDEPTAHLDLRYRNRFMALIEQLHEQIIVLTHDLHLLDGFERVVVVDDGQIIYDDRPAGAIAWYEAQCRA
jgi:biotin transport system ATP-binding protein